MEKIENLRDLFESIWVKYIGILTAIGLVITLWSAFGNHFIILLLGLWALMVSVRLISMTPTKFFDKEEDAANKAIKQLKKVKKSLYYLGGAGFIGDNEVWKKELVEKMDKADITFVRLIDLKSLKEMEEILKCAGEKKAREYTKNYKKWLEIHRENLKDSFTNNFFHDFDGAPIWKFGLNLLIFDKKNILMVFLSSEDKKNAIFIEDSRSAEAITNYIDWLRSSLQLRRVTDKELEEMTKESEV